MSRWSGTCLSILVKNFFELDRAVLAVCRGDHGSIGDIQRCEETRRAVAGVIVGTFLRHARHHRKRRAAGPRQRLDLGLLIDAEHDSGLGWIEVKANDVVDPFHEERVVGEFEPIGAVGFELEGLPDPSDRRFRSASPLRSAICARDQWVAFSVFVPGLR